MLSVLWDLRFACRRLLAEPGIALAAIVTLALGVSATVAMGDIVDRLLLRPPPHVSDPDRVVRLYRTTGSEPPQALALTNPALQGFVHDPDPAVEALAAYVEGEASVGRGPDARRVRVVVHSEDYFDVLGITAATGQIPDRSRSGLESLAVVSDRYWREALNGSADAIGQSVTIRERVFAIAAVLPPGFAGIDTDAVDLWLPMRGYLDRAVFPGWETYDRAPMLRHVIARLAPGSDRAATAERLTAMFSGVDPSVPPEQVRVIAGHLLPARAPGTPADVTVVLWLVVLSGLVLLIACGNVGTLLAVRGLRRTHEVAIKLAVGATRPRLLRELLIEAMVIALGAGATALVLVTVAADAIRTLLLPPVAAMQAPIDERLVALTVGVCVVGGLLLGMLPGWHLWSGWRTRGLASNMRYTEGRSLQVFVGAQMAFALPLVVGAALFVSSLWNAQAENFGVRTAGVVVVNASMAEAQRPRDDSPVHGALKIALLQVPQVRSVSMANGAPLRDWVGMTTTLPSGEPLPGGRSPRIHLVDESYTDVLDVAILEGRALSAADNREGARPVMLVNRTLAHRVWPNESAVGRCLRVGPPPNECVEVVGVMADSAARVAFGPDRTEQPAVLVPLAHFGHITSGRVLLVRTDGDRAQALAAVAQEARTALPNLPYVDVWALDDVFEPSLRPWRIGARVLVAFGLVAVAIAAMGLAVLSAHAVTRRTRELGLRAALGAAPVDLVRLMVGRSVRAVVAGVAVGLAIAWAGADRIDSLLYGISAYDPRLLAVAALGLLTVAVCAAWVPARRAGKVDPAIALRVE